MPELCGWRKAAPRAPAYKIGRKDPEGCQLRMAVVASVRDISKNMVRFFWLRVPVDRRKVHIFPDFVHYFDEKVHGFRWIVQ